LSSLREQKIARKKEEILQSAAAVFVEKGYHGTTMEEIAANLLMTKGSMYYYFKNKDDLLFHCNKIVMDKSIDKIMNIIESTIDPIVKLERAIKEHIKLVTNERSVFVVMEKPNQHFIDKYWPKILELTHSYEKCFDKILKEGIEKELFDQVNINMFRMIILGALNGMQKWYQPAGHMSHENLSEAYTQYLLKMVVKNQK
jgi:AcrR family transcriptional regulator